MSAWRWRLAGLCSALAPALPATGAASGTPAASPSDGDAARRALDAVYARPPLDRLDRPHGSTPLDGLVSRIGDLFAHLHDGLGTPGSLAVGIAAAAALAIAAALLLRRVSAGRLRRVAIEREEGGDDTDAEWAAAEAAAAAGDLREAVRRAFRSALLAVAVAGRVGVDAAWTTRELLAHAAGDADLVAALAPAAATFDVTWYGGRDVSPQAWDAHRNRCAAIRGLARGRRATVHAAAPGPPATTTPPASDRTGA
ncbi:MAG TPA: DUF4129 domain-containing protein [Candidatus Dormibacteraeota bacterium]|nr:DUF4129 domain-containing protein [Candidatus Dormibacteraeota bacterium]